MMANYSKSEGSVLKVRIGNIEPKQTIKIEFDMIGHLKSEKPNTWTLRIPSHIAPRYMTELELLEKLFYKLLDKSSNPQITESFVKPNVEWSFEINLNCSDKIVDWRCPSHLLNNKQESEKRWVFSLGEEHFPEKDLEFTYERENPLAPLCTVSEDCACVSFSLPKS
jgi:hypothetical protein